MNERLTMAGRASSFDVALRSFRGRNRPGAHSGGVLLGKGAEAREFLYI